MGTMFEVVYRKKKEGVVQVETTRGDLGGGSVGRCVVQGAPGERQWPSGGRPGRPQHAKWRGGPSGQAGEPRCGTSVRVVGWISQRPGGPQRAEWHEGPSGHAGEPRCVGQVSVARAKWLVAKGSPAGSPRQARRFESAGSGPVGKVGWGLVGETPTFLHSDLTWRASPSVSAQ